MAAHKGNKYNQKWNAKNILEKLNEIEELVRSKPDEYHLGGFIIKAGLYPQWWTEKAAKFIDDQDVNESIKRIEGILEARIINSTLSGELKSAAMAIFYLKNKHGYTDKVEQEVINKDRKPIIIEMIQPSLIEEAQIEEEE